MLDRRHGSIPSIVERSNEFTTSNCIPKRYLFRYESTSFPFASLVSDFLRRFSSRHQRKGVVSLAEKLINVRVTSRVFFKTLVSRNSKGEKKNPLISTKFFSIVSMTNRETRIRFKRHVAFTKNFIKRFTIGRRQRNRVSSSSNTFRDEFREPTLFIFQF